MAKYYIAQNGQQAGPYTVSELLDLGIEKDTLVWYDGLDDWTPANQIPKTIPSTKKEDKQAFVALALADDYQYNEELIAFSSIDDDILEY